MRSKEFISEDRQKLDEAIFLPLLMGAGVVWQGVETYNDIQDYKSGKIDGKELTKRVGTDAAAAVVGGVAGKGLSLGWNALKSAMKFKGAGKEALDTTKDAIKQADKAPKPGSTIQTPKGPRVAGVDGKTTTIKPGDKKAIANIKKAAKDPKNKVSGKTGAVAGAVAKKGDDVAKVGASAGSIGSKLKKAIPSKAVRRGAIAGALANQTNDLVGGGISDKFSKIVDKINKGTSSAGDVGDGVVYFGKEKNPPMKKVAGVNDPLYTKPNNAVKDSNSPVPTAKDPKLPKQNTTSLSTQPGVK
jgi:hypothetical protein